MVEPNAVGSSRRFLPQPLRSYQMRSAFESKSWELASPSSVTVLYSTRNSTFSPSGLLLDHSLSIPAEDWKPSLDLSELIPLYAGRESICSPAPPTSQPTSSFSLWDDSLIDTLTPSSYYSGYSPPSSSFSMESTFNPYSVAHTPKKSCTHCHVTSTPLWRRHPTTQATLCNACGLYLQQRNCLRPQALIDADIEDDPSLRVPDSEYTGPKCSRCLTRQTSVWRRSKSGAQVCNACGVYARLRGKERPLSLKRNKIKPRTKHLR
ncbi:GATA zinc finger domain-containing protein [Favolaschia claudopus]|uniref:GATA zinc finger domain-containing protein n=1 Tax=Favolaschia claudopus TaxID=2862362 RepID=A0AAW0DR43_9AGAR